MRSAADPRLAAIQRQRNAVAWMLAWLECLEERRPVSVVRTEMELRGFLC